MGARAKSLHVPVPLLQCLRYPETNRDTTPPFFSKLLRSFRKKLSFIPFLASKEEKTFYLGVSWGFCYVLRFFELLSKIHHNGVHAYLHSSLPTNVWTVKPLEKTCSFAGKLGEGIHINQRHHYLLPTQDRLALQLSATQHHFPNRPDGS